MPFDPLSLSSESWSTCCTCHTVFRPSALQRTIHVSEAEVRGAVPSCPARHWITPIVTRRRRRPSRCRTVWPGPGDVWRGGATSAFFPREARTTRRTADLLRGLVEVVQARFFTPPAMLARILALADPVVTSGETFSVSRRSPRVAALTGESIYCLTPSMVNGWAGGQPMWTSTHRCGLPSPGSATRST